VGLKNEQMAGNKGSALKLTLCMIVTESIGNEKMTMLRSCLEIEIKKTAR
jgi:hypothetical protein